MWWREAIRLAPQLFRALSVYFVADATIKTSQNIEEMLGGSVVSPSILALPDDQREQLRKDFEKKQKGGTLTAVAFGILAWELAQQFITKKRR